MYLKNKKGAERYLSIYWFTILIIITSGVVAMVFTFYNSPYDVRELEGEIMINKVASCLSNQGVIKSDLITSFELKISSNEESICENRSDCQKVIGNKIISIVNGIKKDLGIENIDGSVKSSGVAENFECLVLQIAMRESSLQHCINEKDENNNPLYCDGDRSNVKALDNEREASLGVMQVNTKVHNVNPENFEEGIIYAVKNVLVEGYKIDKDGKLFEPLDNIVYYGWEAGIRGYNGWGSGGDDNYVENVKNQENVIKNLFPEFCSEGVTIDLNNSLSEECDLNFKPKSENENIQYYLEVNFYDFNSNKILGSVFEGNQNLKSDCEIKEEKEYKLISKCVEKDFYSIDENNNQYLIKILSVVRKTEENVR